jgi:hypothetical protein
MQRKTFNRRPPDAGLVTLAILSQIPPDDLGRYTLLAAQRVDSDELADDLMTLAANPRDAERRVSESVSMFMTFTDLRP